MLLLNCHIIYDILYIVSLTNYSYYSLSVLMILRNTKQLDCSVYRIDGIVYKFNVLIY